MCCQSSSAWSTRRCCLEELAPETLLATGPEFNTMDLQGRPDGAALDLSQQVATPRSEPISGGQEDLNLANLNLANLNWVNLNLTNLNRPQLEGGQQVVRNSLNRLQPSLD